MIDVILTTDFTVIFFFDFSNFQKVLHFQVFDEINMKTITFCSIVNVILLRQKSMKSSTQLFLLLVLHAGITTCVLKCHII